MSTSARAAAAIQPPSERPAKPRSIDQHRRFFAVLKNAFDNWPETHDFQPDNEEHLRAWLLVKAKHRIVKSFRMSDDASEAARLVPVIMASMLGKYSWAWADGAELKVCIPDSIAFEKCSHQLFGKVCDDVADVIRNETGLEPDELLKEPA